jgi:LysR family transcriptional activator of dmlA
VNNPIDNEDLRVFATAARKASFAAAAEELGMSPAYVSKRIGILEQALGVRLFHRTTRRVIVSEDGERVYAHAMTILENLDSLLHEVAERRDVPRGLLRISSSFGFGRNVVAPVVARLVAAHPSLQVRFEVFDRLVDIVAEGFDLDIRIGDDIAPHLIARKLMANQRILCASPAYLKQHGTPRSLAELAGHNCLAIKERDLPFGVWSLRSSGSDERASKSPARFPPTTARSRCNGRGRRRHRPAFAMGRATVPAQWRTCRYCPSTPKAPMSGQSTHSGWPDRPKCASASIPGQQLRSRPAISVWCGLVVAEKDVMDLHYLSPLFAPKSIVVFAGPPDQPERQNVYGRSICAQLRDGGYEGALTFLDVSMTGTLADLVHSRADLALIALPNDELAFALEVAGRIQCKSALIISSGVLPAQAAELHAIARKHDMHLLGPNSLGYQRPRLNSTPAWPASWRRPAAWR